MNNEIILVDLFDQEIGHCDKMKAHISRRLHRAFSLFIINEAGEMLLQQRAINKYHSGGLWSNSCCSHPRYGESTYDAVIRRTHEELGISVQPQEIFDFIYYKDFEGLYEYEYDHVFWAKYEGVVIADPSEIMSTRWETPCKIKKALEINPELFSAWFLLAAPRVLKMLKDGKIG